MAIPVADRGGGGGVFRWRGSPDLGADRSGSVVVVSDSWRYVAVNALGALWCPGQHHVRVSDQSARYPRPTRFVLADDAFTIPPLVSPGIFVIIPMMISGLFVAMVVQKWHDLNDPDRGPSMLEFTITAVPLMLLILSTAALAVLAWQRSTLALTPDGVRWRSPWFRRLVPWQALATGGPFHPGPKATKLVLVVTQPDLVIQRGWAAGSGPRERPGLGLQVAMHPGFLADAIRWYAEHPANRAAIGTQAEHDRLIAELTAGTHR